MAGLAVLGSPPASAEYSFCNKTSYVLFSAIATEAGANSKSRGWYMLRPGECRTVIEGPLSGGRYYTYAEIHPAHRGGRQVWSGLHPFCVTVDGTFELPRNACERNSDAERLFVRVDVGDHKSWTTDFTELESYSAVTARIAGAQRLFRDIGEDLGGIIDGNVTTSTRRAINRFKDEHGIPGDGELVPDKMIDKLLEVARARQAEQGYQFCNQTGLSLLTAIAYEEEGVVTSRGWFRLKTDECVKVIKDRLPAREFFTYAEAELKDGQRILWEGETALCVSDVKFEIQGGESCEDRGFETAKFQRVDTKGEQSWTQTFVYEAPGSPSAEAVGPAAPPLGGPPDTTMPPEPLEAPALAPAPQ